MKAEIEALKQFGLNEKEIKLYLTSLENGPSTVLELAKKSGMKRTNLYNYIETMTARGFIMSTVSGSKKLYIAAKPEDLVDIVERQKEKLLGVIPELSLYALSSNAEKPRIRFYEGKQGVLRTYNEVLEMPANSETLGYATFEGVYEIFSPILIENYIKRRVERKIKQKLIMPTDEYTLSHLEESKKEMRETFHIPKGKFNIKNEINIFGNKIAIISLGVEKLAVIIESEQIADTQRQIFNNFWELLKEKNKKKK